jgi:ferric-dicitrate binding protein FerR (iron transport regulator)
MRFPQNPRESNDSLLFRLSATRTRASMFATSILGGTVLAAIDAPRRWGPLWTLLCLCTLVVIQAALANVFHRLRPSSPVNGRILTGPASTDEVGHFLRRAVGYALCLLLIVPAAQRIVDFGRQATRTYSTKVGEHRVVMLSDRSQVTLNTDSTLQLRITDHTLQATLLKGEALFSMLPSSTRPFTLVADGLLVTDIGTIFDVKFQAAGGIAVAVAQGSVALSTVGTHTPAAAPLLVNAGQIATHQENRLTLKPPDPEELLRQTTWTSGSLTFRGSTVAEIAAELNRYNRAQLIIEDPTLAHKQITATVVTNDPISFVTKLGTIFPSLTLIADVEGDQIRIRIGGVTTF